MLVLVYMMYITNKLEFEQLKSIVTASYATQGTQDLNRDPAKYMKKRSSIVSLAAEADYM